MPRGERNPQCSVCIARFAEPGQAPVFRVAILVGGLSLALVSETELATSSK